MKTLLKLIAVLTIYMGAQAQGVLPCISINGTANPGSKNITVCPTSFNLTMTNCHGTPAPSSDVVYGWIHVKYNGDRDTTLPFAASLNSKSVAAGDTGIWVGIIINTNSPNVLVKDSVHVHYYPQPPVLSLTNTTGTGFKTTAPNSVQKCVSTSGTATVTPNSLTSYEWGHISLGGDTTLMSSSFTAGFNVNNTIKNHAYYVSAKDNNGCQTSLNLSMNFNDDPLLTLNVDTIYRCANNLSPMLIWNTSHTMNAAANLAIHNYKWVHGSMGSPLDASGIGGVKDHDTIRIINGGVNLSVPEDTFDIPGSSHTFKVRMNGYIPGCYTEDQVVIKIIGVPIPYAGADTTICYGSSAQLKATVTEGRPPYNFTWSNGGNGPTTTVSPTTDITYTVTVTDGSGCGFSAQNDNIVVFVTDPLFVTASNDTSICVLPALGTATLNASGSGGAGSLTYSWLPAANLTSPSSATTSTTASLSATTTFTVTVKDAINCTATDEVTVTRYLPPIGGIPNPIIVSEGKPFVLDASASGNSGFSFQWTNLNDASVVTTSPDYEVKYKGEDTIDYEILVIDPGNNCENRDTAIVWFISDNTILYVPNIFSPGAEFTDNQKLKVFADNISEDGFRFIIFNKWGQVVFETTNVAEAREGWDGGPQIEGVYTYVLEGKFKNEKPLTENKEYMGSFKLSK